MKLVEAAEQQAGHQYPGNLQASVAAEGPRRAHLLHQESVAEAEERTARLIRAMAEEVERLAVS